MNKAHAPAFRKILSRSFRGLGRFLHRYWFSESLHRAYAKRALMKIPSLEEYEKRTAGQLANGA